MNGLAILTYASGKESVTGLHFDPEGTKIAMVDYGGTCLINDLNSDESVFSAKMGGAGKLQTWLSE